MFQAGGQDSDYGSARRRKRALRRDGRKLIWTIMQKLPTVVSVLGMTRLLVGSLSSRHAREVIDTFGHQQRVCWK